MVSGQETMPCRSSGNALLMRKEAREGDPTCPVQELVCSVIVASTAFAQNAPSSCIPRKASQKKWKKSAKTFECLLILGMTRVW